MKKISKSNKLIKRLELSKEEALEMFKDDEYKLDLINNMDENDTVISAYVPLETMFGYATDVRSLSSGRASYSMTPDHFEQVPANVLKMVQEGAARKTQR
jgi:translation elongation factor EF-G